MDFRKSQPYEKFFSSYIEPHEKIRLTAHSIGFEGNERLPFFEKQGFAFERHLKQTGFASEFSPLVWRGRRLLLGPVLRDRRRAGMIKKAVVGKE